MTANERDDRTGAGEVSVVDAILGIGRDDPAEDSPEVEAAPHSIRLLYDNFIKGQVNGTLTPSNVEVRQTDFLSTLASKIQMLEARSEDDDEEVRGIRAAYRSILVDLMGTLEGRFRFDCSERGGPPIEDADMDTLAPAVKNLYNFLVLDRVENVVAYLKCRVFQYRKDFAKEYKPRMSDRRNVSMAALKGSLASFDDVVVMFFLDEIIEEVAKQQTGFSEFIGLLETEYEDEASLALAKQVIDDDNCPFVAAYLSPVCSSPDMLREFTRMVSMALMAVLPKKLHTVVPVAAVRSKGAGEG